MASLGHFIPIRVKSKLFTLAPKASRDMTSVSLSNLTSCHFSLTHCAPDTSLFFLSLKHAIFVLASVPSAWNYVCIELSVLPSSNHSSLNFNVKTSLPNPDKQHPSVLLYLAIVTIWNYFIFYACLLPVSHPLEFILQEYRTLSWSLMHLCDL